MHHEPSPMVALLVLVALSVLGPLLSSRIRMPTAVVLIMLGIGAGPAGLRFVRDTSTVAFVSQLGFLVLMFLAGMEIDFNALRDAGARALLPSLRVCVGFFVVALVLGHYLHAGTITVLVISASSVGMPLAVLQETGQSRTPLGRFVMLTATLGETFSILALTGLEVVHRVGGGLALVLEVLKLVGLVVASTQAIRVARAVGYWYPAFFERVVASHDAAEIGVRAGLLVMLAFVVFVGLFGVEAIVGAFIAGTLVGFVLREKHALESKLSALGHGLFIPVFFVVIGVRFQPSQLDGRAVRDALVLAAAAGAVKLLPTLLLGDRALGLRERLAAGLLLAAPLTLVVAIGAVGLELGVVNPRQGATFVLVAMLLSVVFPVLFRATLRRSDAAGARARALPEASGAAPRVGDSHG